MIVLFHFLLATIYLAGALSINGLFADDAHAPSKAFVITLAIFWPVALVIVVIVAMIDAIVTKLKETRK